MPILQGVRSLNFDEVVEERRSAAEVSQASRCCRVAVAMAGAVLVPPDARRDDDSRPDAVADECSRDKRTAVIEDVHDVPLLNAASDRIGEADFQLWLDG